MTGHIGSLKSSRAFIVALAMLGVLNFGAYRIADVAEDGTKQVVRCKRQWAQGDWIAKEAGGRDIVLFLGNSKVSAGIVPELFDRANGGKVISFNMALPALPLGPHYFLLKEYLRHNPAPKYIVMTLSPGGLKHELMPYYAPINAGLDEVVAYSFLRKDVDILINRLFPLRFYWPEIRRYFTGKTLAFISQKVSERERREYAGGSGKKETFRHDWDRLFHLKYLDFEKTAHHREELLKSNRGYYFIVEQAVVGGALPDDFEVQRAPPREAAGAPAVQGGGEENDPFVARFFDLAASKNIQVILVADYVLSAADRGPGVLPDEWRQARTRYPNVTFARFAPHYFPPRFFSDPGHVNPMGAVRYTLEIAAEFKACAR